MKATISNRIYLKCDDEYHRHILDRLTYRIPPTHPAGHPEVICDVFRIRDITSIPVGRTDLIPEGYEINDIRTLNEADFKGLNSKIVFRDDQARCIDYIKDNCIINAKPAWGKTFTAVGLAAKLRQKTLVVVHTLFLRDQWLEEIKTILPNIKPGLISEGKCDINSPIVVANVQSLKKYMNEVKDEFGLMIIDECHHIPATTFKQLLDKSKARYKMGLSATLGRKDKKHVLIPDYISDDIFIASDENSMRPRVIMMTTDIPLDSNPMTPWGTKINKLVADPNYKNIIVAAAEIQYQKGHKVLIVSDRVEFLSDCHNIMTNSTQAESELVIGATKNRKEILRLLRQGFIDTVWGSIKIFSEGISEPSLSCLILGQPTNNIYLLEQLCGRVTRKAEGKMQPIIIDVILQGSTGKNQSTTRENFYINKGWDIEKI